MLLYILIIIAGIIIDQLTKWVAVVSLSDVSTIPIIPNVFHLTYVENTGAAFSLFEDMQIFLILITSVFICALGYLLYILPKTKRFRLPCFALSLMISGALGNLIDRIRLSYVVDFFDFRIIGFAIFNFADMLVVCGTILLAYTLLKNKNFFPEVASKSRFIPKDLISIQSEKETETLPHKDVLKDLKSEPRDAAQVDITPDVKTNLKRLPSASKTIEFSPSPSYTYDMKEEEVRLYRPKVEINADTIPVEKISQKPEAAYEDHIKTSRPNRYNDRAEQYEAQVRQQREQEKKKRNTRNRYHDSADHYEETIRQARSQSQGRRKERTQPIWDPQSVSYSPKQTTNAEPSIWETGELPKVEAHNESRYEDMVDSYAALVENTPNAKVTRPSVSPEWENPRPKRKNNKRKQKKKKVDNVITNTEPVRKNRYTDSSDSYLKSIEEASKKRYTDQN